MRWTFLEPEYLPGFIIILVIGSIVSIGAFIVQAYIKHRDKIQNDDEYEYEYSPNSSSGSSSTHSSSDTCIPTRLAGIHPSTSSFWNTEEFYVRLGEECARITDKQFVCQFFIKSDGSFSCDFFDMASAKNFFPALASEMQNHFNGTDKQIAHPMYTSSKIREIMQNDGPSAQIESVDYPDGKSINVKWN